MFSAATWETVSTTSIHRITFVDKSFNLAIGTPYYDPKPDLTPQSHESKNFEKSSHVDLWQSVLSVFLFYSWNLYNHHVKNYVKMKSYVFSRILINCFFRCISRWLITKTKFLCFEFCCCCQKKPKKQPGFFSFQITTTSKIKTKTTSI